jgi:uncharacterized protein (DUF2147 family)
MLLRVLAALIILSGVATPSFAVQAPYGLWRMSNGKVTVKVSPCGSRLCGIIAALKEPISKIDGKPKVDRENPNPDLRKRPLIGLSILIDMKPTGDSAWQGAIYNPDDGNTYSATLTLDGNSMKVRGCVAGILCKTNTFVKIR